MYTACTTSSLWSHARHQLQDTRRGTHTACTTSSLWSCARHQLQDTRRGTRTHSMHHQLLVVLCQAPAAGYKEGNTHVHTACTTSSLWSCARHQLQDTRRGTHTACTTSSLWSCARHQLQDTRRGTHTACTTSSLWSCARHQLQDTRRGTHMYTACTTSSLWSHARHQLQDTRRGTRTHSMHHQLLVVLCQAPAAGYKEGNTHVHTACTTSSLWSALIVCVHACTCERVQDAFICMQLMGRSKRG